MEYYAENKFKTEDDELLEKEVMKIAEEIIKKTVSERDEG